MVRQENDGRVENTGTEMENGESGNLTTDGEIAAGFKKKATTALVSKNSFG